MATVMLDQTCYTLGTEIEHNTANVFIQRLLAIFITHSSGSRCVGKVISCAFYFACLCVLCV